MSTLTGNEIKNTYQGLLKLDNSTTGVTQTLQSVEDGLGNQTGLRIKVNQLDSPNSPSFYPLKAQYYGTGFQNIAGTQFSLGTQNIIMAFPFYDQGFNSYSAITFNTQTITSTSDTFESAIYSAQMINPFGPYPHQQIVSGITATTSSTGLKTFTFTNPISMSGYGSGLYFLVFKVSNGGVQPTWRPGNGVQVTTYQNNANQVYGVVQTFTTATFGTQMVRGNNAGASLLVFTGLTSFDSTYSSTINTSQSSSTTITGNLPGFLLHTVGV
jgi:hypothetical protein